MKKKLICLLLAVLSCCVLAGCTEAERASYNLSQQAVENGGRKSIPESWCPENGIAVAARQLRVNWRYDVAGMMEAVEGGSLA